MSKKNSKSKNSQDKAKPTIPSVIFPAEMSQEEMQHIIANAIAEAQKINEEVKRKQKEADIRESQEIIGLKTFHDKSKLMRGIKTARNQIKCFFKICFLPRKYIKGDRVICGIMSMLLTLFFAIIAAALYCISLFLLIFGIYSIIAFVKGQTVSIGIIEWYAFIPFSFLAFEFASLFRIASIEIEKVEDRNHIQSLLSTVLAIIAAVFAYLSLIKE